MASPAAAAAVRAAVSSVASNSEDDAWQAVQRTRARTHAIKNRVMSASRGLMRDPKCNGRAVSSRGIRAVACATAAGAGLKPIAAEKMGGIRFKSESRRMSAACHGKGKLATVHHRYGSTSMGAKSHLNANAQLT